MRIASARFVAFQVLKAVAEGAYASDSLLELSHNLDGRDAALAAQIVFGCLRFQLQLDYLIHFYSGRGMTDLDEVVIFALRMAIFQLRYLDRIPAHAAVHETVELVKLNKRSASGFANAVLRKVNREPIAWPDVATEVSCPAWMLERWTAQFGGERAKAIAEAALVEPIPYIRVRPGEQVPAGVEVEATAVEGCFRLLSEGKQGIRQQDIGSQSIIPLLGLEPHHAYLDLCAAPGNKTLQALETPLALAIACDVSEKRIRTIPPVCPRVVLNACQPLPFSRLFDRIFIDSPCSGTGTLARNPEIKWRVQADDFTKFRTKQVHLVLEGVKYLAIGGKLLYATCSLEREENDEVIRHVLAGSGDLRLEQELWRLPGREEGDGFYAAVLVRFA